MSPWTCWVLALIEVLRCFFNMLSTCNSDKGGVVSFWRKNKTRNMCFRNFGHALAPAPKKPIGFCSWFLFRETFISHLLMRYITPGLFDLKSDLWCWRRWVFVTDETCCDYQVLRLPLTTKQLVSITPPQISLVWCFVNMGGAGRNTTSSQSLSRGVLAASHIWIWLRIFTPIQRSRTCQQRVTHLVLGIFWAGCWATCT